MGTAAHEVITAGVIRFEVCFKMRPQKLVNCQSDCGDWYGEVNRGEGIPQARKSMEVKVPYFIIRHGCMFELSLSCGSSISNCK